MAIVSDDHRLAALVEERARALTRMDIPALSAMLHESYRYVDSLGRDLSRADYLRSRAEGEVRIESQHVESRCIARLSPDMAMITLRTFERVAARGQRFEARYQVVHVCVRNKDRWLFLFGQSTTVSPHQSG
jgi:hypothetical protein